MSELTESALVGLAALGAGAYLVRGIVRALRPRARPPACEHCAVADLTDAQAQTAIRPEPSPRAR